jgi:hypothetical protein
MVIKQFKLKYPRKVIPYPQYNYVVAVCPKMIVKNQKQQKMVEKQFCHNDCDLHIAVFSEEVIQKYEVHLLCIPNESLETIEKAMDIMERMYLSKTQLQLKEILGIDKEGFPEERDKLIKTRKEDSE